MECKKDKCALSEIYPKTNASIACDCDCYFEYEPQMIPKYKKKFPTEMKKCGL
jgi:hypothetical protein